MKTIITIFFFLDGSRLILKVLTINILKLFVFGKKKILDKISEINLMVFFIGARRSAFHILYYIRGPYYGDTFPILFLV